MSDVILGLGEGGHELPLCEGGSRWEMMTTAAERPGSRVLLFRYKEHLLVPTCGSMSLLISKQTNIIELKSIHFQYHIRTSP